MRRVLLGRQVMKFVMVTFNAVHRPDLFEYSGVLSLIQGVTPKAPTLFDKQMAIKQAMIEAVQYANVGDVVMQDDIAFSSDPFKTDLVDGMVTILNPMQSYDHQCPRAFRFPTPSVRDQIVEAWTETTEQTCTAWMGLTMYKQTCTVPYGKEPPA